MSDKTLNQFLSRGTHADRLAYTPSPPVPFTGPSSGYFYFETDTGNGYSWDGATWQQIGTSSSPTTPVSSGTAFAIGLGLGDEVGDGDIRIPGPQGLAGSIGSTGPVGPAGFGFPGMDGEDGSDSFIQGPQGIQGIPGTSGISNVLEPVFVDGGVPDGFSSFGYNKLDAGAP